MKMMKNPVVLVTCVLLLSSLAVLASEVSFGPDDCCFDFYANKLPAKRVLSHKYTDTRCSIKAVIFTMKKGTKFCVNPSEQWVQGIIEAKVNAGAKN